MSLSAAQKSYCTEYVLAAAKKLGVDRVIKVKFGRARGAFAEISFVDGTIDCEVQINPPFWRASPADKRATIAHELLHSYTAELEAAWDRDMIAPLLVDGLIKRWRAAEEMVVDRLSRRIDVVLDEWVDPC